MALHAVGVDRIQRNCVLVGFLFENLSLSCEILRVCSGSLLCLLLFTQHSFGLEGRLCTCLDLALLLFQPGNASGFFFLEKPCMFSFTLSVSFLLKSQSLLLSAELLFKFTLLSCFFLTCLLLFQQTFLLIFLDPDPLALCFKFNHFFSQSFLDQAVAILSCLSFSSNPVLLCLFAGDSFLFCLLTSKAFLFGLLKSEFFLFCADASLLFLLSPCPCDFFGSLTFHQFTLSLSFECLLTLNFLLALSLSLDFSLLGGFSFSLACCKLLLSESQLVRLLLRYLFISDLLSLESWQLILSDVNFEA